MGVFQAAPVTASFVMLHVLTEARSANGTATRIKKPRLVRSVTRCSWLDRRLRQRCALVTAHVRCLPRGRVVVGEVLCELIRVKKEKSLCEVAASGQVPLT